MSNTIRIVMLAMWVVTANAATYYIDYTAGNDANAGTSTGSSWKRHPYMTGFTGSYSHTAGDVFYFKGGETWPNACFPLTVTAGGSGGTRDYYTATNTWYSGGSFTKPIFSAGGTTMSGANRFVTLNSGLSYITFQDIVFSDMYWDGALSYGDATGISIATGTYITMSGLLFTNWTHGASTTDGMKCILGQTTSPFNTGSMVTNCVFDAGSGDTDSGLAVYYVPIIKNSIARNMSNGFIPGGFGIVVSGNTVGPINDSFDAAQHENGIEILPSTNAVNYVYGNTIFDPTAIAFYSGGANNAITYVYNNLVYSSVPIALQFDPCAGGNNEYYVWNNTLATTNGSTRIVGKAGSVGTFYLQNNHLMTDGNWVTFDASASTVLTNYNRISDLSTDSVLGYTSGNLWAPTAADSPTVDAGTDLSSYFTTDITGATRSGSWDIGAYEYDSGGGPEPETPPASGGTITIQTLTIGI